MEFKTQCWISGKYVDAVDKCTFSNVNPATGQELCKVQAGGSKDVDLAVESAKACLNSSEWGYASTSSMRSGVLRKFGDIIEKKKDAIARLDSLDNGKPLREALADLDDAITACSHFADLCDSRKEETIDNGTDGQFTTVIVNEPVGVVGAITPWNYPFLMAIWKVIPAIAAGCTVVLKPSELAPLSCIWMGELFQEAGLPDGALNIIPGLGPEAGAALTNHSGIDKISFTGSVPTAQRVMSAAALGPRGLSLELGGKSPLIVFEDADVESVVDWIILGFCWGSGQVCSATSRVLLHKDIKSIVVKRLIERVAVIRIGDSLDPSMVNETGPTMGPVVNQVQYDKILAYIHEAKCDPRVNCVYSSSENLPTTGFFISPTIFLDVPVDARIWKEEIFGPVLCIREFENEEEAICVANDTEFGLAGAVFSTDLIRSDRVARALRCGIVWKNCCQPAFVQAPWGGVKKSGFGRELGKWGLEEFTAVKQVTSCAPGFSFEMW